MSQHDLDISTGDANTGLTFRAAVNSALQALGSQQSGASAPGSTYAYELWADTATGLLKQRNGTNTGWIVIGTLDVNYWGLLAMITKGLKPRGLYVRYNTDAQLKIDVTDIWVEDYPKTSIANLIVDISTTGAGGREAADAEAASTWYYVWLITKSSDGTTNGFLSKTSTPTLPSGYDKKRLISMWYNNSSSNLVHAIQKMGIFQYNDQGNPALASGTATSWTNVSVAAFIPPNVSRIRLQGQLVFSTSGSGLLQLAAKDLRGNSGNEDYNGLLVQQYDGAANEVKMAEHWMTVIDQSFDYRVRNGSGSYLAYVWVWGFEIEI